MIFQRTWEWVLDKSPHTGAPKTQTIRLLEDDDKAWINDHDRKYGEAPAVLELGNWYKEVERKKRQKYKRGNVYSVCAARGGKALAQIRLMTITLVLPSNLHLSEIEAEGFASQNGFNDVYAAMHGLAALDKLAWALAFRKVN